MLLSEFKSNTDLAFELDEIQFKPYLTCKGISTCILNL